MPVRVGIALVAAGLTAAAAQFTTTVPFTAVPFTLTPIAVLLSGAVLGSRLGALSQVMYVLAGAFGLAVFSPSVTLPPGALRLMGPTGGYLMAYPLAAFVTGSLAERGFDRRYLTSVLAMLAGLAIIFTSGVLWLGLFGRTLTDSAPVGIQAALATGLYPFLLPDTIKLAIAAGFVPALWRVVGRTDERRESDGPAPAR